PVLFLEQGGLLGGNGRRLDTKGLGLRLSRGGLGQRSASSWGRPTHLKLERADGEGVAVGQQTGGHALAVDERAGAAVEVAQHQTARGLEDGAVQRVDVVDVEPDVAAGRSAEQGEKGRQGTAGPGETAVLDDHLARGGRSRRSLS